MSDQEKFRVFKEKKIRENEEKYGEEIRNKYGTAEVEAYNQKMLNMPEEEWNSWKQLEVEILAKLKAGVWAGIRPESGEAREIVLLHREWLKKTWKKYSAEAHKGVAALYITDERFKAYYDKEAVGCAELLTAAIQYWADKI